MTMTPNMRADARRNRAALIAAAREVFVEEGAEGPLEEIAARAGVGIGTLYRHFPDRNSLLLAVFEERWAQLLDDADRFASELPPREALEAWLRSFVTTKLQVHGLVTHVLEETVRGCGNDAFAQHCTDTEDAAERLVARCREAGVVAPDLTGAELFELAASVVIASEHRDDPAAHSERLLALVLGGVLR